MVHFQYDPWPPYCKSITCCYSQLVFQWLCSLRGRSKVTSFWSHTDYSIINLSFPELAKTPFSPHIIDISITPDVLSFSPTMLSSDISTDSYYSEAVSSSRPFQSVMPTGTLESCATTLTTTVFPTIAFQDMCELCNPSSSSSSASTSQVESFRLMPNNTKQEQLSGNENSNNAGKKRFKLQ